MEYREVLAARHSVRSFSDREVPREVIDMMIEEAETAPSSKNTRSTAFMVIEDHDTIAALSEMRDRGSAFLKDAPAAVVILGDTTKTDLWEVNCAISTTILQLSAVEHGLGSCWVHVNGRLRSKESEARAEDYVKELLGIRPEFGVLCVVALGYPQE